MHDPSKLPFLELLPQSRYEVGQRVSHRSTRSVFKARDYLLERDVALKVICDSNLKAAVREARAVAQVGHANTLTVFDLFVGEQLGVIAAEWAGGGTLAEHLREQQPLSATAAAAAIRDAAQGLAAAHSVGLVHGDVKLSNLFVTNDRQVKVGDFGCCAYEENVSIGGTPETMSPEQLRGEPIDSRSDIFALGVALWTLLTGRSPLDGRQRFADMLARTAGKPLADDDRIPLQLRSILDRATAFAPGDRHPNCHQLASELNAYLLEMDSAGVSPERYAVCTGEPQRVSRRQAVRPTRRLWLAGAATASGAVWLGARSSRVGDSLTTDSLATSCPQTESTLAVSLQLPEPIHSAAAVVGTCDDELSSLTLDHENQWLAARYSSPGRILREHDEQLTLNGWNTRITDLAASQVGHCMVAAGHPCELRIWPSGHRGNWLTAQVADGTLRRIAISPDATCFSALVKRWTTGDTVCELRNIRTAQLTTSIAFPFDATDVAFVDSATLAVVCRDQCCLLSWLHRSDPSQHLAAADSHLVHSGPSSLWTVGRAGLFAKDIDSATGTTSWQAVWYTDIRPVSVCECAPGIACVGDENGNLWLFDRCRPTSISCLPGHPWGRISSICVRGDEVLTAGFDGTIRSRYLSEAIRLVDI